MHQGTPIQIAEMGAGEIMINSIERDGTMAGYDIDLIEKVANSVTIPIIACGGMGMANGALMGLGAVYAEKIGLSVAEISLFVGGAGQSGELARDKRGKV